MEKKEYDFLFGIILMVLGLAVIWESIRIWIDVGDEFTQSPGLMPAVLGAGLSVAALSLVIESYSAEGKAVFSKLGQGFASLFGNNAAEARNFTTVLLAMGFFTFILMPNMPFWLSSFIFMIYTMVLAGARKPLVIFLIAAGVSIAMVIIFEVIFRVPLPTSPVMDAFFRNFFGTIRNLF